MKDLNLSNLVVINQEPDGMALMTVQAWKDHQDWVLKSFMDETDSIEAKELLAHYLNSFDIQEATRKNYNFLIQICKLEVNTTKEITSFVGEIQRF